MLCAFVPRFPDVLSREMKAEYGTCSQCGANHSMVAMEAKTKSPVGATLVVAQGRTQGPPLEFQQFLFGTTATPKASPLLMRGGGAFKNSPPDPEEAGRALRHPRGRSPLTNTCFYCKLILLSSASLLSFRCTALSWWTHPLPARGSSESLIGEGVRDKKQTLNI